MNDTPFMKFSSLTIHPMEDLLIKLRANAKTRAGRAQLRRRTVVEHRLALLTNRLRLRAQYPMRLRAA